MDDVFVFNIGGFGGGVTTEVCFALTSANLISHQPPSESSRVRTSRMNDNPLTHDRSDRIPD